MKNLLITGGCGFIGSNFINYIYNLNHNINIININRDTFESAISFYVAKHTGIAHKYVINASTTWYQTSAGKLPNITKPIITIDNNDFEIIYMQFITASIYKQKMADELNCITVNYNSLRMDCLDKSIPFQPISHLQKLYDEDYSSIITNYDQLLEIKEKILNK